MHLPRYCGGSRFITGARNDAYVIFAIDARDKCGFQEVHTLEQ